ncbi:Ig-like domain-containing protein, partial [Chromohalobacter sp. 48-RD10]|uniref:Ig-like domain-containing protein n=1 Tax=Chromohalobacter sp. 48-RD10 TaxID=2994063 RepID=UPI002468A87B
SATLDQTPPALTIDPVDDPISNDSPALSGSVDDPDATVTVTVDREEYAATNNGDGTWALAAGTVDLAEGDNAITVNATDPAGNPATPVTETISVDVTAPAEGDNTVNFTDDVYNAAEADTATLTGQVEDGATIDTLNVASDAGGDSVVIQGDAITLNDDGAFTTTADLSGLDDGELTATLALIDAAGNTGTVTDTATLDQTPPALTIDPVDDPISNDSPALSGTVDDPDATVTVTVDREEYAATNNGDGTWALAAGTVDLAEGDNAITVNATDPAGNTSDPVTETVSVDVTAPAEGDNTVAFGDDVYNAAEADTADLTGQVEDGATIDTLTVASDAGGDSVVIQGDAITLNDDGVFTTTADLSGLDDGELTATLSITDAAGNTGTVTDTATLDQTPPVITLDPVDDPISNDSPALSGTVDDPDATVTVTVDREEYAATNNGDGTWALAAGTVDLAEGDNAITVNATDPAGNPATPVTETVSVDVTAPAEGDNTVSFGDDVYNAADADTATLTGQVEDGATIDTLTIASANGSDPVVIQGDDITLEDDGSFSYTADLTGLPDGDLTATLSIADAAGNSGTVTDTATLDTTADAAPTASLTSDDGDGLINADEAGTASYTVGGLDPDATAVASFTDGTTTVTADVAADGTISVDLSSLTDGEITSSLAITDEAGNSATVAGESVTLDTTADAAPTASLTSDDGDGLINADEAAATSYTVSGLGPDATAVASFTDGTTTVTADVAADGTISVDLSGLADGEITSSLTITDEAGNSATVTSDSVTLDTTAPTVEIDALDDPIDNDSPALTGTVDDPDATVTVTIDGTDHAATVDGETWSIEAGTVDLAEGDNAITVNAIDPAGNPATPVTETVSVDVTAPDDPTIASASDDVEPLTDDLTSGDSTNDTTPTLTGTAEANSTIEIFQNGTSVGMVDADGDGSWNFTPEALS